MMNMIHTIINYFTSIKISPVEFKILCAILGPIWGLIVMRIGYSFFDRMTDFVTSEELKDNNIAVATVIASIFIGCGICTGIITGFSLF